MASKKVVNYMGEKLPKDIRDYAWKYYDKNYMIIKSVRLIDMFNWMSSDDGYDFWQDIWLGNYKGFYSKIPSKKLLDIKDITIVDKDGYIIPDDIAKIARTFYEPKFDGQNFVKTGAFSSMFDWSTTAEELNLWADIDAGNYEGFYERYSKKESKEIDNFSII